MLIYDILKDFYKLYIIFWLIWKASFVTDDYSEIPDSTRTGEEESLVKSSSKLISRFYEDKLTDQKPKFSRGSSLHEADQKIVFESLDPGSSYTITVSTVMNGIEIASKEAKIYQMGWLINFLFEENDQLR